MMKAKTTMLKLRTARREVRMLNTSVEHWKSAWSRARTEADEWEQRARIAEAELEKRKKSESRLEDMLATLFETIDALLGVINKR